MSKSENRIKALLRISRHIAGMAIDDMTPAELKIAQELVKIQFLVKVDNNGIGEYATVLNTLVE